MAIKQLYSPAIRDDESYPWSASMPLLDVLPLHRTKYYPMKPVFINESTTANNISIINDLYNVQIGVNENDKDYDHILRLITGDWKTWKRIEAAKSLRTFASEKPFDKFHWILPSLGLWHLKFNFLQLIHTIHWGNNRYIDNTSLSYAADRWNRSRVAKANDFQALERLIIQSYQARIIGTWLKILARPGIKETPATIDATLPLLRCQSKGESGSWMQLLGKIGREIRIFPPSGPVDTRPPIRDQQYENHQNFCSHVETYLTLKHAIETADIGLLRHVLRKVTIIFQAKVGGTPNYGQALLRMLHATDSPAATVVLQDAILANSLVNLKGLKNSSFPTDKLLELLNLNLKTFQRERSQFSKNSDELLAMWAINGPYFLSLQTSFESMLGGKNSGNHPEKQGSEDLFSLGRDFSTTSLIRVNRNRFTENPTRNLFLDGLQQLGSNVFKYNGRIRASLSASDDPPDEEENEEGFTLIDDIIGSPDMSAMDADILDLFPPL